MRCILLLSATLLLACPLSAATHNSTLATAKERTLALIKEHMPKGDKAQAQKDAEAAAKDGQFGFIDTADDDGYPPQPLGVDCFTPWGQSPDSITFIGVGHVVSRDVSVKLDYGSVYNRTLVAHPDYPFRDLCVEHGRHEENVHLDDPRRVTIPARAVTGPPRDLFEAARRGSAREVRMFVSRTPLNVLDGTGMTALAWAVARNNQPAIDILVSAGANPWQSPNPNPEDCRAIDEDCGTIYEYYETAVYWAAALGRRSAFVRLQRLPGRPFRRWPSIVLGAAMMSNDRVIFGTMLTQPHEEMSFSHLRRPLPKAFIFAMALEEQPNLATPLLFKALGYETDRAELVRMALAKGADPNAVEGGGSPLDKASMGHHESSIAVVDMLLKAGADPNHLSDYKRPVWIAYDTMIQHDRFPEFASRATIIFDRLIAAGADLNLPDRRGLRPIWFLLFPYSPKHDQLDPHRASPTQIEMLTSHGLDVNAEWKGKRVLSQVEAQAGPDSELARMLRKLGAKS